MKKTIFVLLLILSIGLVSAGSLMTKRNIIVDFGDNKNHAQAWGYTPPEDSNLYVGAYVFDVLFYENFTKKPVVLIECEQDDRLIYEKNTRIFGEAYNITTKGFKGICYYQSDKRFRNQYGSLYNPMNMHLVWTAHSELTPITVTR